MLSFLDEYYGRPSQKQIRIHPAESGRELRREHDRRSRDVFSSCESFDPNTHAQVTYRNQEILLIAREALAGGLRTRRLEIPR